jgi:hypothetical protein
MSQAEPWFRVIGTEGEIVVAADFAGGMTLHNATHAGGVAPPLVRQGAGAGAGAGAGGVGGEEAGAGAAAAGGGAEQKFKQQEHRGFATGFLGSFSHEWHDICHCLATGAESTLSPPSHAVADVCLVEALYASERTGRWEPVAPADLQAAGAGGGGGGGGGVVTLSGELGAMLDGRTSMGEGELRRLGELVAQQLELQQNSAGGQ